MNCLHLKSESSIEQPILSQMFVKTGCMAWSLIFTPVPMGVIHICPDRQVEVLLTNGAKLARIVIALSPQYSKRKL